MVRQLLGNIKGPKGDTGAKGDKGDRGEQGIQGSLKDETIGVVNIVDISNLTPLNESTPITDFEINSGVVHYSDVTWNVLQSVTMRGVKHSFRVADYQTNPDYASNRMGVEIRDSNDERLFNQNVNKGQVYEIDLTGRETQEYIIRFKVTDATSYSGFIEKPMLVEGDIPVLWSHPNTVGYLSTGFSNVVITSQGLNNDGTKLPLISNTAITKNCSVSEGSIVLKRGIWKLTVEISFENTTDENLFYIRAIQNSNTIATSRGRLNGTTYSLNLVIETNGDPIDLYVVQNSGSNVSTLSASFNRVMAEYLDTY